VLKSPNTNTTSYNVKYNIIMIQLSTGSHVATSLPGIHAMKPGSCGFPFLGIELAVLDALTGLELDPTGMQEVEGLLCIKSLWPSIARTLQGDHDRL
jgi:acetyl-CoA synthetase